MIGRYEFLFDLGFPVPDAWCWEIETPEWLNVGKRVSMDEVAIVGDGDHLRIVVTIEENPIPVAVIVGGIAAILLGLTAIFTLKEVNKLVDSPTGSLFVLAIVGIIAFAAWKIL